MSETATSMHDVFRKPEFEGKWWEYRRAHLETHEYREAFVDHLSESGRDEETIQEIVEMTPEDYEERFNIGYDYHRFRDGYQDRQGVKAAAKTELINFSQMQGANTFALHGLKMYLPQANDRAYLEKKVTEVEADFTELDTFVRRHEGQILTILGIHIYAGRIGCGGISLEKQQVEIPIAANEHAYIASQTGEPELYMADGVSIYAGKVHGLFDGRGTRLHDDWSPFLNGMLWTRASQTMLVAGEAPSGPPHLPFDVHRIFHAQVFERLQQVNRAAIEQPILQES